MAKSLVTLAALALVLLPAAGAQALVSAPDNSLESLLVRATLVVIASVTDVNAAKDTADVKILKTLKGHAPATPTVENLQFPISPKEKKPRFAAGDTVLLFLDSSKDSVPTILQSQKLATEADRKAMEACITEILPFAQPLADLHDPHKVVDEKAVHTALTKLIISHNAFTQVLLGRLMATALPDRLPPDDNILFMALLSPRPELKKGALIWAQKYKVIPPRIALLIEDIASDPAQKSLAKLAAETLKKTAP